MSSDFIVDYQIDDIDWENLDFKILDLNQEEIELLIENFGNLLNNKTLLYLKRKINYKGYNIITSKQRYYQNHKESEINRVMIWQKENREDYLKKRREREQKKREEQRLAEGKKKSNRGRPRKL